MTSISRASTVGEFQLAAGLVAPDAVAALRDHGLEHARQVAIGQSRGLTFRTRFLIALLERRLDQPHDRHRAAVVGLGGGAQRFVQLLSKHRWDSR